MADLSRRDADVVVRATSNPPDNLVGRRVADLAFCAYAHRDYLDRAGRQRPLDQYEWLGFDERLARTPQARWLNDEIPMQRCRYSFDSSAAMHESARCGLGAAILPCFAADPLPELERISEVRRSGSFGIWVLTHPDLRRSARVRAFTRDIGDRLTAHSAQLAGLSAVLPPGQASTPANGLPKTVKPAA